MNPLFTITEHGFTLSDNGLQYVLTWVGEKLMVTGPDVCYYLLETARGLEQANCALTTFTLILPN
jgi:cytochrome oxidase assembly protein ShyY1